MIVDANKREQILEVVCNSAFPHCDNKPGAMLEMARVLKRGGRLSIFHPGIRKEINHFHRQLDAPVSGDYLPSDEEITAMAQAAGLKDISITDGPRYYLMTAVKI
ncbi:MAG: methyltransferase domain-containing protein [Candidatus Contubernalis sp.]|nr:methyltransferase domain-containing protein [Candidatus Contubernalis sp.]